MIYKNSQSVFDYLVVLVPDIINNIQSKNSIDPKTAKKLFNVWRNEENKISTGLFQKPVTMSTEDVSAMEKAGLVKSIGNKIEITSKGEEVIRVMILGDNDSIFEDNPVDYNKALATTKEPSVRTAHNRSIRVANQQHETMWWDQFLK